jgi:hypothetical protein
LSFPDDNLPLSDEPVEPDYELYDEDSEASDADEEMSGEPEEEFVDEGTPELEDDAEDDEPADDDETAELKRRVAEYEAQVRRAEYERQQAQNAQYWDDIEGKAVEYFEYEYAKASREKDNYVDPDLFYAARTEELRKQERDWTRKFEASKREAARQQYERAAVPTYAARVATHFDLTPQQAEDLLDYDPQVMVREAEKMARYNAQITKLRNKNTQNSRKNAQDKLVKTGAVSGEGRGPAARIKRGSDEHLMKLWQNAGAIR